MAESSQLQFIWKQVLSKAEMLIAPISYDSFIKELEPIDIRGRRLILKAATDMTAKVVMKKHAEKLREAIVKCDLGVNDFRLVVADSDLYPEDLEEDAADTFQSAPINKNFTFESFVTGAGSKFVYAAAKSVAEAPGEAFSTLPCLRRL